MMNIQQTHPKLQMYLQSAQFTEALELIAKSKIVLSKELSGIKAMQHFDVQLFEIEKNVEKVLNHDLIKYVKSDLNRNSGSNVLDKVCKEAFLIDFGLRTCLIWNLTSEGKAQFCSVACAQIENDIIR
jgi:hypothetical protein